MRKRKKKSLSITEDRVGEAVCRARRAGCIFASTHYVHPVVGKMAAGCAALFITLPPRVIDFAPARRLCII